MSQNRLQRMDELFIINIKSICKDLNSKAYSTKQLNYAINKDVNSAKALPTRTKKDLTSIIKKELLIFELESNRGKNLEMCYENLQSIPPTSVESERMFSSSGIICTKIRSSLNDESLDILCFLCCTTKKRIKKPKARYIIKLYILNFIYLLINYKC